MGPLVSVLIPVYNARRYVREAIESVQAQTYSRWEAVVVDDGSTDGSGDVVAAMAAADDRIRLHRQVNRGLPAARNAALEQSRGELVGFLDADDVWLPHKLERQTSAWVGGVLYSDAFIRHGDAPPHERIGDHVRFARGEILDALIAENVVPVLTAVVESALLVAAGGFDASLRNGCEDYDLWLRLAADGVRFDYVNEPLAVYRMHGGAMSRDAVAMTSARLMVLERARSRAQGEREGRFEQRIRLERRAAAAALRQRAWREALTGEQDRAHSDLRAAYDMAPTVLGAAGTRAAMRSGRVLRALARWRGNEPGGNRT